MKQLLLGWGLCALLGSAAAQQVWKCEQDGVVRYTDQPCEAQGRPVPSRNLQPNGVDVSKPEAAASVPLAGASAAVAREASGVAAQARPVSAIAERSARRRGSAAHRRPADPLAPAPPGFIQRGNPRAQQLAALPRVNPVEPAGELDAAPR